MSTRTKRVAAIGAVGVLAATALTIGITQAADAGSRGSFRQGTTQPVPTLNNGESATFQVIDNGRSIVIRGDGKGMAGAKSYVSLIYTDTKCSKNTGLAGLTVDGAWQPHGNNRQKLYAEYDGAAYRTVRNKINSVSIREVTAVDLTNNAAAQATLTPRACAALTSAGGSGSTTAPTTAPTTSPSTPPTTVPTGVVAGDEFNYTGSPASAKWGIYSGAGHNGNGTRTPSAFSVANGVLSLKGDARGNSGGMAYKGSIYRGTVEARMRVLPNGDRNYHPVLLLWPDKEDWPVGGEVDYAEAEANAQSISFFLHYSASNQQTQASTKVDLTQWHTYKVVWTASSMTGYVDGVQFFKDTNVSHLPPRPMHATIQLDNFSSSQNMKPTEMQVDYIRMYAP